MNAEIVNEAQRGENEGESSTIRRLLPEESQSSSIKDQLRAHLSEVNSMSPVAKIPHSASNKLTVREKVGELFRNLGYKVDRKGFGVIEIGEKQIRKSMNYLSTDGELAALAAVPNVLKRGIDISGHENHKGRSFSTVTFAAPVEINGVVGNVAVVVQMVGKNNYHTHRILMPDGSEFIFKKENAEPRNAGVKGVEHRQGPAISSASDTSISQNSEKSTDSGEKVSLLYDMVNIVPKKIVASEAKTAQDRRSTSGTTTNSISQNSEKSTDSGEKVSEADNGSMRRAVPKTREAKKRKLKRAQEHQRQSKAKKKAERMAEAMRGEDVSTNREDGQSGTPVPARETVSGRGYTDAEANEARKMVKDFDMLQPQARRAIIELYRSGKACGASSSFMRHAANLIAYWRRGLWIIADDKMRDDGFFYVFDDGTRLITVKPRAEGRSITEAFMHELGHDVWERADHETRRELYRLAVDGVDQKELKEIRERYETELGAREETVTKELIYEEIFANLLGERIGTEDFLSRFSGGNVSALTRIKKTLSVMKKRFAGKDKYLYRKADDLFRAFTKVMAGQTVSSSTAGENKTKYLLATDSQGEKVVVMYEDVLEGKQGAPHQIIADRIAMHIGEYYTIFESGQRVYIGEDLPNEYTQSKYTQNLLKRDLKILKVKNRASQNLGEMIEIATDRKWEKAKHTSNKDAKYGFYRYTTKIAVPVFDNTRTVVGANIYRANLLIRNASDGKKYLYDITEIKKERSSSLPQSWITKIGKIVSTSSANSIAQKSQKSTSSAKKVSENNGSQRSALPKDKFIQTAYVTRKKGNLATPIGEQAPINTPKASRGTVSNNSIAQNPKKSTSSTKKVSENRVKLNAEAHIDELSETLLPDTSAPVKDSKSHAFAKDGFIYRTAYFQDFDGQYYKLRISVGQNGGKATVYNVGKITKDVLPSSKATAIIGSRLIAVTKDVAGSQPLQSTSFSDSIAQNSKKSTDSAKKVSENNGSQRSALPKNGGKSQTSGKTVKHSAKYYENKIQRMEEKHEAEMQELRESEKEKRVRTRTAMKKFNRQEIPLKVSVWRGEIGWFFVARKNPQRITSADLNA